MTDDDKNDQFTVFFVYFQLIYKTIHVIIIWRKIQVEWFRM